MDSDCGVRNARLSDPVQSWDCEPFASDKTDDFTLMIFVGNSFYLTRPHNHVEPNERLFFLALVGFPMVLHC